MKNKLRIHTEYIKLKDALKFAGLSENGGAAKMAVLDGSVKVNGEICLVPGKKLYAGDSFETGGEGFEISKSI